MRLCGAKGSTHLGRKGSQVTSQCRGGSSMIWQGVHTPPPSKFIPVSVKMESWKRHFRRYSLNFMGRHPPNTHLLISKSTLLHILLRTLCVQVLIQWKESYTLLQAFFQQLKELCCQMLHPISESKKVCWNTECFCTTLQ